MNKVKIKILSFMLCAALFASLSVPAFAAAPQTYSDISGHWAQAAIERWSEREILSGYPDGTFRPNDAVSTAELASILNRIQKLPERAVSVNGLDAGAWYYKGVSALLAQRMLPVHNANYAVPLTRGDALYMIGTAFGSFNPSFSTTVFSDYADFSSYTKNVVSEMKYYGFISGYPDGSFHPDKSITRAEVITILDNMIDMFITTPGAYEVNGDVGILVQCDDVTINCLGGAQTGGEKYSVSVFAGPSVTGAGSVKVNHNGNKLNGFIVGDDRSVISYATATACWTRLYALDIAETLDSKQDAVERMGIAMGSMLNYTNSRAVGANAVKNILSTEFGHESHVGQGKSILNQDTWGIMDKKDLILTVVSMTGHGHNDQFLAEADDICSLTAAQRAQMAELYSDGYLFDQIYNWSQKWGDRGIVCWDLFRMANLVQWGYAAGYITYDEALALLEPAAIKVMERFNTWEEAYDNYLDGYAWWSRADISEGREREDTWELLNALYPDVFDDTLLTGAYSPAYSNTYDKLCIEAGIAG